MSEFALIRRYFADMTPTGADVLLGIGDDGAVLRVPDGFDLVVTTDTLLAGRHFEADADPADLGFKALAVNLSDLAAMGAQPVWFSLALTLPAADAAWLDEFAAGMAALARQHAVALVGGDTTRGPLSMTVTAHGLVPAGAAVTRSGARVGDLVFVTGTLGDAALALHRLRAGAGMPAALAGRLNRPQPRTAAGCGLSGLATAAIDISDGLLADAGHICTASGMAMELSADGLPLSSEVGAHIAATGDWQPVLAGGDDYELLFTVAAGRQGEVAALADRSALQISRIGHVVKGRGVAVRMPDGSYPAVSAGGFDHFGGCGT